MINREISIKVLLVKVAIPTLIIGLLFGVVLFKKSENAEKPSCSCDKQLGETTNGQ